MDASQLSLVLALGAAAGAGTGDYLAAHASRSMPAIAVAAWVQALGLVVVAAAGVFGGWPALSPDDLAVSVLAGLSIAVGLAGLYGSLAIGPIGVTAPIAAVVGAAIPVVVDISTGQSLATLQYGGLLLGLVAVALLASGPADPSTGLAKRGIAYAVLGGVGIGAFTLALDAASPSSGLWPLAISRGVAAIALFLAATRLYREVPRAPVVWSRLCLAGFLDSAAMIAFLFALRMGYMSLVAVITALYPAFTVALATVIDRERMLRTQVAGIVVAAGAIIMISWSG
jgi:drug/metabolite transporter (DMT)-like permease